MEAKGVWRWCDEFGSKIYVAEVSVQRESMLMLKATYHPNWHAYVEDVGVTTVMLMPSYIGVKLAPGHHTIRMEYRPRPLRGIRWLRVYLFSP